jgi:hypothetical protein
MKTQTLHLRIQTPSGSKEKKEEESNIQYTKKLVIWLFGGCWRWLGWAFFTSICSKLRHHQNGGSKA